MNKTRRKKLARRDRRRWIRDNSFSFREWVAAGGPMMHLFGEPYEFKFSELRFPGCGGIDRTMTEMQKRAAYGGRKGKQAASKLAYLNRPAPWMDREDEDDL
jgi:hypothetical protein